MPTDGWLIFAYFMIFSSVILCGILLMIFRLLNARQDFYRYSLERLAINYSCRHVLLTSQSIYNDVQLDIDHEHFPCIDSHEQSITYVQIPFIDDDISV